MSLIRRLSAGICGTLRSTSVQALGFGGLPCIQTVAKGLFSWKSSLRGNFSSSAGKPDEPAWLDKSADSIVSLTDLSRDKAKASLLVAAAAGFKGVKMYRELRVDLIRPVVDVLVRELGPQGGGEVLEKRGSLLWWYREPERLSGLIKVFRTWVSSNDDVIKLLLAGSHKLGRFECSTSPETVTIADVFF